MADLPLPRTGQRVLLLGSYAPSLINFRGALIAELIKRGHEVVAAAPDIDEKTGERLRALGASYRSISMINSSYNPLSMAKSFASLRRLLQEIRPDTLIAYTIKPVILGALAGWRENVSAIVVLITGLGYAFAPGRELKRRTARIAAALLYRFALSRAHLVLFQNPDDQALFVKEGLLQDYTVSAVVAGSGVDLDHFSPLPTPKNDFGFLMIGRLLRDKGVEEFARAALCLKQRYPHVRFDLVGYIDPSPASLTVEELDRFVQGGLNYVGRLEDVRPALANCNVYVLPSTYREGVPRSVLEAMSVGRAIITTDMPGCRETVVEGINGFLVPPRDADSLMEAMDRLISDPELANRMGVESRQLAEQKFDVHKVNADILARAGL